MTLPGVNRGWIPGSSARNAGVLPHARRGDLSHKMTKQDRVLLSFRGFPTRIVYLYNDTESRYTILVANPSFLARFFNASREDLMYCCLLVCLFLFWGFVWVFFFFFFFFFFLLADRLASTADITSGLQLGWAELLRSLRNVLNMDRPEFHGTDWLKERGIEKGGGRHSTLRGRKRIVFNQTNTGTVSRATFGRMLRGVWTFPSSTMPS